MKILINNLKFQYRRAIIKLYNKLKLHIYNWEYNKYENEYANPASHDILVGYSIYNPVRTVMREIETMFTERQYYNPGWFMCKIHGVDVNTQFKDHIEMTIRLRRPGIIIGKGGEFIYELERRLTSKFGKDVRSNIVEVKNDINEFYVESF